MSLRSSLHAGGKGGHNATPGKLYRKQEAQSTCHFLLLIVLLQGLGAPEGFVEKVNRLVRGVAGAVEKGTVNSLLTMLY